MFDGICEVLYQELDQLDEKYSKGNGKLTMQDLETIDKATHSLKSIAGYEAMKGNSENGGSYDSGSYARGRSRMTGRYISRDGREGREYDPYRESEMYRR